MPKIKLTINLDRTFQSRSDETSFMREIREDLTKAVRRIIRKQTGVQNVEVDITGENVEPD